MTRTTNILVHSSSDCYIDIFEVSRLLQNRVNKDILGLAG